MVDLPEGTDPHSYYPYTRLITTHENGRQPLLQLHPV